MDMRNLHPKGSGLMRRVTALLLALCLCMGLVPAALSAESVGNTPAALTRSAQKYFIQVPASGAVFFTGATYGTGTQITVPAGTVCQLVSDNYYSVTDTANVTTKYYGVFYNNIQYQVRCSDVTLLSETDLNTYIQNSIWKGPSYPTLKKTLDLVGDVRVYALQLALNKLGYYSGSLDGDYGQKTDDAVYRYQKSAGLSKDGDAGPITQAALYSQVSGTTITPSTGTGTVTGSTGTLKTSASVNLREKASKNSPRLAIVPINSNLTYYDTSVSGNVTWYKVIYGDLTGWLMGTYVKASGATSGGTGSTGGSLSIGNVKTIDQVNLRKKASKSSVRLGIVPKGITLSFSDSTTVSGVTWYQVTYGGETGWIMGTYTNLNAGGGGVPSGSNIVTGKVSITKPGTAVRLTPGGKRSGTLLSNGSIVDMLDSPVTSGSYTWYKVKLSNGLIGYVRGDCATASTTGSTIGGGPSTTKKFIRLPADTALYPAVGATEGVVTVKGGTVLMMAQTTTTVQGGVEYCQLYYGGKPYFVEYGKVSSGLLDDTALAAHVLSLWNSAFTGRYEDDDTLVGDVGVYAMQVAMYVLGYYTGELDGSYGNGSEAAVRNFQRKQKGVEVDGIMGPQTWPLMAAQAKLVSNGSTTYNPGTSSGGTAAVEPEFGTVYKVKKAKWNYDDNGAELFPKFTTAQVMDVETNKVFTIYRWAGGNHADCVPSTANDTKIMCDIVGAKYQSQSPNSDQLKKIKEDTKNNNATYCWPDFNGNMGGTNIGAKWDRRAAWLNVNGTVYCVSIYGYPHGWMDDGKESAFTKKGYEKQNNYYGMMCIHFVGSKTHGGDAINSEHQAAIDKAYSEAKKRWGTLVE